MITAAQIARDLELARKATPGPWANETTNYQPPGYPRALISFNDRSQGNEIIAPNVSSYDNAEFIARARTALPEYAEELREAWEILDEISFCEQWELDHPGRYVTVQIGKEEYKRLLEMRSAYHSEC